MTDDIKVSVCVVTYNQEKYIAACLQSLVEQQTDFAFEIIVGEDCSTDNTRLIIDQFFEKYPHLIIKNYQDVNVGAVKNAISSYRIARGEYICHIDGDDGALPNKLQEQSDILDSNPSSIICSHDMKQIDYSGKLVRSGFRAKETGLYTLQYLYSDLPFFAHSSKMFRNDLHKDYWNEFSSETLDIELHVSQVKRGSIYHINKCLGFYRLQSGISSIAGRVNPILYQGTKRIFEEAIREKAIDIDILKSYYSRAMFNYAYQSAIYGNVDDFRYYINKSISLHRIGLAQSIFTLLSHVPYTVIFLCRIRALYRGYIV